MSRSRKTAPSPLGLVASLLALVLAGASGPAAADKRCFLFTNEDPAVPAYHVAFESDRLACPTGTCWQADVPHGQAREYCPDSLLYPAPMPGARRNVGMTFSQGGNVLSRVAGALVPSNKPYYCRITSTADGRVIADTEGCEAVELWGWNVEHAAR